MQLCDPGLPELLFFANRASILGTLCDDRIYDGIHNENVQVIQDGLSIKGFRNHSADDRILAAQTGSHHQIYINRADL